MKTDLHNAAALLGSRGGRRSVESRRKSGGMRRWAETAARKRWGYTLKELAKETKEVPENWRVNLKEFYRAVAQHPSRSLISAEPPLLDKSERNAFLAVVAEEIAKMYEYDIPSWVLSETRKSEKPYFGNAPEGMKPYLIQQAPFHFRRHGIFMDPDDIRGAIEKAKAEREQR